jgi:hypothetical protein
LNEQVVMLAQPINPNTTVEVSSFSALMWLGSIGVPIDMYFFFF